MSAPSTGLPLHDAPHFTQDHPASHVP
jgi:hypothetical protein